MTKCVSGYGLLALSFLFSFSAHCQSVKASSFGFDTNPNQAILSALKSPYDTIVIDQQSKPWVIRPLVINQIRNKVIVLEKGTEIHAMAGAFLKTTDALLTFKLCENIQILGNGAVLCMKKEEYTEGEWRHGISLRRCKNFRIENLKIKDSGGDGIYIAGLGKGTYSENITIDSIQSINNKRQGLSIISGKDITITNSIFTETKGTLPGAGLDIEPNNEQDVISNIKIENCIFKNNYHAGIMVALGRLTAKSHPVVINFKGCLLENNHAIDHPKTATEIILGSNMNSPVKGEVVFEECIIENSRWGLFYSRKRDDAYSVTFKDCIGKNICQQGTWPPVFLEVPHYRKSLGHLGGYKFENLFLDYRSTVPFMVVRGSRLGTLKKVKNIRGDVTILGEDFKNFNYINYDPKNNEGVDLEISRKNL